MKLYRCMHDIELMCHEQRRQLWHFLCPPPYSTVRTSHFCVRAITPKPRQLLHFWFLNYFPLTRFHIVNRVRAITPKQCPRLFKEQQKGIKYYPCPSHTSVRTSVHPYVPLRVRAITPKPYGIYSGNFMSACIPLIRCVCPSVHPTSCPGHNS